MTNPATVIFDGTCNLCNATVAFITARAAPGAFAFVAAQSPAGDRILVAAGREPGGADSIVLIDGTGVYERSEAALRIAQGLRRPWRWLGGLRVVPAALRDPIYAAIARNRHRFFGTRA